MSLIGCIRAQIKIIISFWLAFQPATLPVQTQKKKVDLPLNYFKASAVLNM